MPTRSAQCRKAFPFRDFKALDEAHGTFEGYLAVFNNVDLGGDVIEPGAFTKTLHEAKARRTNDALPYLWPILWQHDEHEPIGGFTDAYEDSHGLYVKGQLDLDTDLGRRAYSGMHKGYMRGLSIGYDTLKHKWQGDTRHLQELRLWEGSAVTFPMNQEASATSVKADGASERDTTMPTRARRRAKARDFTTTLTSIQASDTLQEDWHDTFQALVSSLYSTMFDAHYTIMGADTSAIDPAAAVGTILEQFSAAMQDVVARSLAADFMPMLDDDGDSFDDPDDDDDSAYDCMSADMALEMKAARAARHGVTGVKAGRTLSAENHQMMTKALDMIGQGHKALSMFATANAPSAPAANGATDGVPSQSDNVYDPGFGKSIADFYEFARARTGAGASRKSASTTSPADATVTTPPLGAGAGRSSAASERTHAVDAFTPPSATHPFATLLAEIRHAR